MTKIKSNVTIPQARLRNTFVEKISRKVELNSKGLTHCLKTMKYGQCVIFKCDTSENLNMMQRMITGVAHRYCKTNDIEYTDYFTTRYMKNGVALFCISTQD